VHGLHDVTIRGLLSMQLTPIDGEAQYDFVAKSNHAGHASRTLTRGANLNIAARRSCCHRAATAHTLRVEACSIITAAGNSSRAANHDFYHTMSPS